jgi:hypothetical protein
MGKRDVSTAKFMDVRSAGQEMPCLTWYKNPQLVLSVSQWNPVHSLTPCLRSILVFVCHLNISHEVCSVFQLKFSMYLWPSSCMLHVLPIHLDLITIIVLRVQITNILHFPVVSSHLDSTSPPQHYWQTLAVSVFLRSVQGQVTHPW